jgi:hypothetical protein
MRFGSVRKHGLGDKLPARAGWPRFHASEESGVGADMSWQGAQTCGEGAAEDGPERTPHGRINEVRALHIKWERIQLISLDSYEYLTDLSGPHICRFERGGGGDGDRKGRSGWGLGRGREWRCACVRMCV